MSIIDQYFQPRGACFFCNHPDARHRIFDAIKSLHKAGDRTEDIADDFEIPVAVVLAILDLP